VLVNILDKLILQYFCFNLIHQLFTFFHFIFLNIFASIFATTKVGYRKQYFVLFCHVKLTEMNVPSTKNIVLVHGFECFRNIDTDIYVWFEIRLFVNPLAGWNQLWIIFGGDNSQLHSKGILDDNSFSFNFVLMLLHRLLLKVRKVGFDLVSHFHHYHHFLPLFVILGQITNWWLTFRNLFDNRQWSSFVSFLEATMPMTIAV